MIMLTYLFAVQLELHAHEQLDKAWRRLAKRDAKAMQSDPAHTPAAKQPEAVFLPGMLDEFLQVSLAVHPCMPAARACTFDRSAKWCTDNSYKSLQVQCCLQC